MNSRIKDLISAAKKRNTIITNSEKKLKAAKESRKREDEFINSVVTGKLLPKATSIEYSKAINKRLKDLV